MNNKKLVLVMFALVVGIMMFESGANSTSAATRWVNDDKPAVPPTASSCNKPSFNTIQAVVTAAAPGDTINVCPETYPAQATVPAGKNNLTLRSTDLLAAIIKAPPVIVDPGSVVPRERRAERDDTCLYYHRASA